ncbi:MAG: NosD domain-containing protein [Candidatus Natronoplasma sp.]
MEKKLSTVIMILILLSILGASPVGMGVSSSLTYENSEVESQVITNISIEGDEDLKDFASEKGLNGTGSDDDPFLLENSTIDGMDENYSVLLEEIELHFVIKNCKIYNSSSAGIKIDGVSNFTLENSVVKGVADGDGISIESSENIMIKDSSISENDKGIFLGEEANNNTITTNNISDNDRWGVHISNSNSNHNLIYHNIFYQNGTRPQARDEGENQWNQEERGGNYWSDYEERYPNANESTMTGIWDTSYEIEVNNSDGNPLISPIGPPTNFRARTVRDEYIEITWNPPRYSIRHPVEEIILYRSEERKNLSLSESVYRKMNSSVQLFRDENITEGEEYHYGLRASNGKYVSVMSEIDSAEPDTDRPEINRENQYPRVGAKEVPINATIEVEFDEEMDEDSISISVEDAEGEEVEGELYGEGTEFSFEITENLSYDTAYSVKVNGSDIAKNWMESPYTWSFTTVSDTGTIIGRIVNEEGEPLDNVQIYVDDDHQTSTYPSGEFQIEVPSGNVTLEVSSEGYEDKEIEIHINQSEEKEIEDIVLKEREGIISRWFWPLALAGGGILLLGIIALVISFYHWEEEEPPLDEDIYDEEYEDITAEEFESWWEDEDS